MAPPTDQQIARIGMELLNTVPHKTDQPTQQFCTKFALVYNLLEKIAVTPPPAPKPTRKTKPKPVPDKPND